MTEEHSIHVCPAKDETLRSLASPRGMNERGIATRSSYARWESLPPSQRESERNSYVKRAKRQRRSSYNLHKEIVYGVSANKRHASSRKKSVFTLLFKTLHYAVGTGGKEMCKDKIRPEEMMGGACDECKGVISKMHLTVQMYGSFTRHFCSVDCFVKAGIIEAGLGEIPRGQ